MSLRAINELVVKKQVPASFEPCLLQIFDRFVSSLDKPQLTKEATSEE